MSIRVSFLITGRSRLPLLCAFDGCPAKKETHGGITEGGFRRFGEEDNK